MMSSEKNLCAFIDNVKLFLWPRWHLYDCLALRIIAEAEILAAPEFHLYPAF
jgi:hypothetical protein